MNQLSHDEIAQLVIQAQNGDQNAFAALYTATVDRQLFFATAFLQDAMMAEDVVQDVYVKMFRSIQKLDNPKVFVAYLNRICYNACVDYKKKHNTHKYELDEDRLLLEKDPSTDSMPEDQLELNETNSELRQALATLSNDYRSVFLMRYYKDMKIREVADNMNLSESTVKRYLKAATKELHQRLHDKMLA